MKSIQEIYTDYKILPNLQLHQLRVAGVAKTICDSFTLPLNKELVLTACLLHDMGNIIKSDLSYFPEFVQPEGLEYWQQVKDDFIKKYGPDEHTATYAIAEEIGVSKDIMMYLQQVGFSKLDTTAASNSFEQKICSYSDMRVGPYGVISMEERLADGRKRYTNKKHVMMSDRYEILVQALQDIEKQIFEHTNIKPEKINDATIKNIVEELKTFSL